MALSKRTRLDYRKAAYPFDPASADRFGVHDKQLVALKVGDERGAILLNVVCRVHPTYALECHLDFDEGNALGITSGTVGQVVSLS